MTKSPHFVVLPYFAQGHLLPMVDIARLLATRGVVVTILLTPNLTPQAQNRVNRVIHRAIDSGLEIHVSHLKLPLAEAGLSEDWENFDMLTSFDGVINFRMPFP